MSPLHLRDIGPPPAVARFPASLFAQVIEPHLNGHDLVSLGTSKGRTYIEVTYRTRLRPGVSVIAAASAISAAPGIEDVQLRRLGSEDS